MNELETLTGRLQDLFQSQRIVVWDDPDQEYVEQVVAIDLDEVETVRIDRNEFGVKARILVEEPNTKFLLYRANEPSGDDWLLDLRLAYGSFRADRVSMLLDQLGLDRDVFRAVVIEHPEFFRSTKRTEALRRRLHEGDTVDQVLAKMSAVLAGAKVEHRFSALVRQLLLDASVESDSFFRQLVAYGLDDYLWRGFQRIYGYASDNPSIDDFVLWMFEQAMGGFSAGTTDRYRGIEIDFKNLRVDRGFSDAYTALSRRAANALEIPQRLGEVPLEQLLDNFVFEDVDRRVILELVQLVRERKLAHAEVERITQTRLAELRGSRFESYYRALDAASGILNEIAAFKAHVTSFADGIEKYRSEWYRIDQRYRQFLFHAVIDEHDVLAPLRQKVESAYVFEYLHAQGLAWQQHIDSSESWPGAAAGGAGAFFAERVKTIVMSGRRKVAVIISDALRFEVADELRIRIRREDRFDAELEAMVGVLPSFTQLGMAALLPHAALELTADAKAVVDGHPAGGTENRAKILAAVEGTAVRASDLLKMSEAQARELFSSHQVLYVYHDRIDAIGDDAKTEGDLPKAAEEAIREIIAITKRLANANASNILVTADHGFQYQDAGLEEPGYLSESPKGGTFENRRFVIGRNLEPMESVKTFTSAQLGLDGDLTVQIPKSTHRIRRPGAGTRFVHGGASLQEIVVPVLAINKSRRSDTRKVEVQLLKDSDRITTGQLVVRLNQLDPVDEKVHARTLRIALYAGDTVISNVVERAFDQTTDDARARVQQITLLLTTDANAFEGQTVELRVQEREGTTNHWRTYVSATYTLKRSFIADF
ncbi:BREX-1 system phosphatase PglZ type A [Agromyces arachidis]|uniref:BREX-1 system phosphatase PglZ type A n=1 Tax=Agromyces arachidis TaxID=766966 RepID=UPI004055B33A